ncbi:immunity protein YezG family protein [Nocardiopsis algeriensis]|uniref:DUF600 family protein n=1 Tax=Nocardiopsis algeriensis TaxID=1478215 RepID=A0A841ITG7_9ACTN|nr:immunity protein YezG family protein [Nocardiopsis algeriensis]MBB6119478.1 hypothetical protein [Nocardiopsis algeriensis]
MDTSRQEELVREMALEILEGAPDGWTAMNYRYEHIGRAGASENLVTFENGEIKRKRHPRSVMKKAISLKEGMHQEGKGTWLSMELTITQPGRFKVEFNYDKNTSIHPLPPLPGGYAYELEKYPRDPEYIPDWLQEKLRQAQGE